MSDSPPERRSAAASPKSPSKAPPPPQRSKSDASSAAAAGSKVASPVTADKNDISNRNKDLNNTDDSGGDIINSNTMNSTSPPPADEAGPKIAIDPTKDLWANITLNVRDSNQEVAEVSLLMVGGSGSGKTSLLQRIYSSDSSSRGGGNTASGGDGGGGGFKKVRPTTALDYSFARRSDRNFSQVAHFWELAQNRQLSSLADIILSPDNIHSVVCAVVVDLFNTEGMAGLGEGGESAFSVVAAWDSAVYWLKKLDGRSAEVLEKMRAKGSTTPDKLLARAHNFCGGSGGSGANPDLKRMRLSGLPTILVVNKMDLFFQAVYNSSLFNYNKETFALLVKAFRFLAHLYGCHVIFTAASPGSNSSNAKSSGAKVGGGGGYTEGVAKWRNVMSHLLFQTPFDSKNISYDLERDNGAVLVTADKDSFVGIGEPPITGLSMGRGGGGTKSSNGNGAGAAAADSDNGAGGVHGTLGDGELERWRAALEGAFPLPDSIAAQQAQARQGTTTTTAARSPTTTGGGFTQQQLYGAYAEPAVDAMRRQKDEELEQYRKTARLRANEAK